MEDPLRHLVTAAREGDDRALEALVVETHGAVRAVCHRLGSDGEVDDLVQDVYLRAVRALPGYRGDAPVLPWLLAIARNTCADHVRRRQRERRLDERAKGEPATLTVAPPEYTDDLLDALDPDRRDAFVLTALRGFSYVEAAARLGCPVGTIRSRVARARADLAAMTAAETG